MPLMSRSNSCVDIDFTLRRVFKKTSFRLDPCLVKLETWDISGVDDIADPSNEKLSWPLLIKMIYSCRPLRLLERAYAFNCLL